MAGRLTLLAVPTGDYARVWDATRKAVETLAPGCTPALLGPNACRIYHLEVATRAA